MSLKGPEILYCETCSWSFLSNIGIQPVGRHVRLWYRVPSILVTVCARALLLSEK